MKGGVQWRMDTVTPSHDGTSCSNMIKVQVFVDKRPCQWVKAG